MEKINGQMWHEKSNIDEQDVERVRQAEKMVKFLSLAKNIPAFKGKSVEEVFSNNENKREFIKNLTSNDFIDLLKGINALLRGKEIDSPEMGWVNMQVGSRVFGLNESFSHRKDKADLYIYLFNAMQELNQNEENLEDIAFLCGASINAIHGFADGNGRTSRFIFSMLNGNLNNKLKEDLRELLVEDGRKIIDIDPSWIGSRLDSLIEKEVGIGREGDNKTNLSTVRSHNTDVLKEKTSVQDYEEFSVDLSKDDDYILYAIFACFKNVKNIEEYVDSEYSGVLDVDRFIDDLTREEVKQLIEKYWELKKRKVEILIDCIAHPKKREYQIGKEGKKISMKDYLKEKIKNESEEHRQLREEEKKQKQKEKEELAESLVALEQGGNNPIIHDANVLNSLRKIEKKLKELILAEKQEVDLQTQESDNEKAEKLKSILTKIAKDGNSMEDIIIEDRINDYFSSKKQEMLKNYKEYVFIDKVLNFLDKAGVFKAKISVAKEHDYNAFDDEKLFGDLFTRSIYYIAPNNSSLRIKLYNVNHGGDIVQPLMEQIFLYHGRNRDNEISEDAIIFDSYTDVDNFLQELNNCPNIFEISSPEFNQEIQKSENTEAGLCSPLETLKREDKLYIKIPKDYVYHFGYKIAKKVNL